MPPKRDTSRNSQSDSGPITELSQNELRRLIREEVKATIKDEVDALSSRLGNIEQQMKLLADLKATVNAVETSITYTSGRIDDLCKNSLPTLACHIQEVTMTLFSSFWMLQHFLFIHFTELCQMDLNVRIPCPLYASTIPLYKWREKMIFCIM